MNTTVKRSKKKEIPYELKRLAKRRTFRSFREAQKWFAEHGIEVSLGWLSAHKNEWQATRKEQRTAKFLARDKTFDSDLASRIMYLKGLDRTYFSETQHFTKEELLEFTEDTPQACAAFAKKCLVWKGKPVILQDYQLKMIEGWLRRKANIYAIGRGGGKDFTLAVFLLWECITKPNTRVLMVCPALRQVKTFVQENFFVLAQTSGVLYDSIEKIIEEELTLTNGSSIFTYGATSFIKGKHNLDYVVANEAAEIPEHVFENVLIPMLGSARGGGHLILIGVPAGQQGFFWKAFQNATSDIEDESSDYYKIQLPTSVNSFYDKEQLELNRKLMSEEAFLQEHEAQFMDIQGALFSQKLIDSIKQDYETNFGVVDRRLEYYLGVDWGRLVAYSVFTILSVDKHKRVKVEYIKPSKEEFPAQIAWITSADKIYNFKRLSLEYAGIGIPPAELVRKELGASKVKLFKPTSEFWFSAFTGLRDIALEGRLVIPAGELKLIGQLRLLSFQVSQEKLSVKAEGKDDYAQSLAIAFAGVRKGRGVGVAGAL